MTTVAPRSVRIAVIVCRPPAPSPRFLLGVLLRYPILVFAGSLLIPAAGGTVTLGRPDGVASPVTVTMPQE